MLMQFITVAGLVMVAVSMLGFIFNAIRKQRSQGALLANTALFAMLLVGLVLGGAQGVIFYASPGMS